MTSGADESGQLWEPEHPVLKILRERRASGSTPRNRTDSAKVGLAIEGGGMRGVISGAMVTQLEDDGFTNAFDAVYGCSSGALNGAYFLAGGCWRNLTIYYEDLLTRQFVDFRRALVHRPILGLDYAFDEVLDKLKPLDYEAAINSAIELVISVTDVDALETTTLRGFSSRQDLKATLRASTWLPIAVHGTTELNGRRVIDGGVLTALPFRLALNDGCTHVLALSTKPMRPSRDRLRMEHRLTRLYLERMRRGLGNGYIDAIHQKHRDQAWFREARLTSNTDGPYVLDLAPLPWMPEMKRHELNYHRIVENARLAYEVSYCATAGLDSTLIRDGHIRAIPKLTMVDTRDGNPGRSPRLSSGLIAQVTGEQQPTVGSSEQTTQNFR